MLEGPWSGQGRDSEELTDLTVKNHLVGQINPLVCAGAVRLQRSGVFTRKVWTGLIFEPMGKEGDGMRKLSGLAALADLHQAMGGERADLSDSEQNTAAGADAARPSLLYVSRDKKARKGKEVTLVEGFEEALHGDLARDVAKSLKVHCGVGGGWKDGVVLLQGDHRKRTADWLESKGYRVKHKGG